MADTTHEQFTQETGAVHPGAWVAATDPGNIGAHKLWVDTSSGPPYQLKKRDASNSTWEDVGIADAITDPTTGRGSFIVRDASALDDFPIGAAGTFIGSDGTDPLYTNSAKKYTATGDTGATSASAYVGATTSGAPASGAHIIGDYIIDRAGKLWICTTAGTPGTWKQAGAEITGAVAATGDSTAQSYAPSGLTGATAASAYVGATSVGSPGTGTFVTGNWVIDRTGTIWICTAGGSPGTWTEISGSGGGTGSFSTGAVQAITTVTPAGSSSLTVTVPTGYKNLTITGLCRGTQAAVSSNLSIRFNSDSGSNYDYQSLDATSTTVAAATNAAQSAGLIGPVAAASAPASTASMVEARIFDYENASFHKAIISSSGVRQGSSSNYEIAQYASWWRSTAAVTSITLTLSSGNFDTGSTFTLWGESISAPVLLTPASNLLFEQTLTATQTSINTGVLSSGYRDLRVVVLGRGTASATSVTMQMQFNNDTGSNYDSADVTAGVQNSATIAGSSLVCTRLAAATAPSDTPSGVNVYIPNAAGTTFHKTLRAIGGVKTGTSSSSLSTDEANGWWRSTAAITSVQLSLSSGDFAIGSTVRVYGEPTNSTSLSTGTGTRLRLSGSQSIPDATLTTVNWDTEDADADNQHYTSSANLTGTASKTAASATLTGSSTAFTTELSVGQVISVPGTAAEKRVVIAIASNTSLTVNTPFVNSASGQTVARLNSPIVIRQPGFYSFDVGTYWPASTDTVTVQLKLNDTTVIKGVGPLTFGDEGVNLHTDLPLQTWDFVEVVVRHVNGGSTNLTADQRTHFACNSRPTVIIAPPYARVEERQASGANGGTFTSGAWRTRALNTIVNNAGIVSLASSQVTLLAGEYEIYGWGVGFSCNQHQTRIRDVTNSVTLGLGAVVPVGTAAGATSPVGARFRVSNATLIELQHQCITTKATNGLGQDASFGEANVYAMMEIRKVG